MQVNAFQLTNEDLDRAFEDNQFRLIYQPQISTKGAKVTAAEAYVRWFHPNFGPIPPGLFLSYVHSQGRTRELTNYLLRQGVEAAANWKRSGLNWVASINIGVSDLADGTMPLTLEILLREYDLEGQHLSLDIRESSIAAHWNSKWPAVAETIREVRKLGVGVALECSGPESINFDELDATLFSQLKVGGPAILQFAKSTKRLPFGFIQDRVKFAHKNNLDAIAVGAEDAATLLALKQLGFDHVQGNAVCPPVSLADLNSWRRSYVPPSLYIYADEDHARKLEQAAASVSTDDDGEEIALTVIGKPVGSDAPDASWQKSENSDEDVLEIELTASSEKELGFVDKPEEEKDGSFLKGLLRRKIQSGSK